MASQINATGSATDTLSAIASAAIAITKAGSGSLDKVVHYLAKNRPNFNSLVDVVRQGPAATANESDEVGLRFYVQQACTLTGSRIFKAPAAAGSIPVTVWNYKTQTILTTATLTWTADDGGWREFDFDSPVNLAVGTEYAISYFANSFVNTAWRFNAQTYLEWPFTVVAGSVSNGDGTFAASGCYLSGSHGYPSETGAAQWYWIDPRVEYDSPLAVYKGGREWFGQFPGWNLDDFPISVFSVDAGYFAGYQSIGVTVPSATSTTEARDELVANGIKFLSSGDALSAKVVVSDPALAPLCQGYIYHDEPDLQGPGASTTDLATELSAIRAIDSTRPAYFGWGAAMLQGQSFAWWPNGATAEVATANWRASAVLADIASGDDYQLGYGTAGTWQYGVQVDRLRDLNDGRTPVWVIVETAAWGTRNPTFQDSQRAAMLGLIHGARGIMWFDHQWAFSASDGTDYQQDFQVMLHDPVKKAGYTAFHAFLQSIKGALWAPDSTTYTLSVASSNTSAGPVGGEMGVPIHTTIREDGGYIYVLAQAARPGTTAGTFSMLGATGATITVLNESRTLSTTGDGVFTDTFGSDYEYHVYRMPVPVIPIITTLVINPMQQNVAFSQQITQLGDLATFTASGLPGGLSISSGGLLSGTPSGSGSMTFTVTATNSHGSKSRTYTVAIEAAPTLPVITTTNLGSLSQNHSASVAITYTGSAVTSASVTTGALPAGLSVSVSSGAVTVQGTPTAVGAYSFTLTVTNAAGSDAQAFTGNVDTPVIVEHSVFGASAPPYTLTTYTDGGEHSWIGEQFYISSSPTRAWEVVGARLYVPAGSALIGKTGRIGLSRDPGGLWDGANHIPRSPTDNGSATEMGSNLVQGWNDFYFDETYPANSGDSLLVAVALNGYYLFAGTAAYTGSGDVHDSVRAADGVNLYLAESTGVARCGYLADDSVPSSLFGTSSALFYGIDIIIRET